MCSLFSLLFLIGRFESLISTRFLGDFFIGTFDVRVTRSILRQPTPRGPYQWANPLELRQFSEKSPLIIVKSFLTIEYPHYISIIRIYIYHTYGGVQSIGVPLVFIHFQLFLSTIKHPATSISISTVFRVYLRPPPFGIYRDAGPQGRKLLSPRKAKALEVRHAKDHQAA